MAEEVEALREMVAAGRESGEREDGATLVSRTEFQSLIQDWKTANHVLEKLQAECVAHKQQEVELRTKLAAAQTIDTPGPVRGEELT